MAVGRDNGEMTMEDDRPANELDDLLDRDELRRRYYGLLQELRVLIPGSQVLVAFLLTVPFNNRFTEVDPLGQRLYGASLGLGVVAIVCFIAPTAFHRVGPRRSRSNRLQWAILTTRVGLGFLALSLVSSLLVVSRFVFGNVAAVVVTVAAAAIMVVTWVVLPHLDAPPSLAGD